MANSDRIKETYVSPTLRLMFLREEFPGARVTYGLATADEVGLPTMFRTGAGGPNQIEYVVTARVEVDGHEPAFGYKEIDPQIRGKDGKLRPADTTPSALQKLQTMALGRALKQMGIPDDALDFKVAVLMKRRFRELNALGMSGAIAAIGAAATPTPAPGDQDEFVAALVQAANPTPDDDGDRNDDGIDDAEVITETPAPARQAAPTAPAGDSDDGWLATVPAEHRDAVAGLTGTARDTARKRILDTGWSRTTETLVLRMVASEAEQTARQSKRQTPPPPADSEPEGRPALSTPPAVLLPVWTNPAPADNETIEALSTDIGTLRDDQLEAFKAMMPETGLTMDDLLDDARPVTVGQVAHLRALLNQVPF